MDHQKEDKCKPRRNKFTLIFFPKLSGLRCSAWKKYMRLKGNCCAFNIVALKSRKQMVLKCLGNLRTMLFNMFDHQTSPKRVVVGSCFIVIGGSGISLVTSYNRLRGPVLPGLARLLSQDFESTETFIMQGTRKPKKCHSLSKSRKTTRRRRAFFEGTSDLHQGFSEIRELLPCCQY